MNTISELDTSNFHSNYDIIGVGSIKDNLWLIGNDGKFYYAPLTNLGGINNNSTPGINFKPSNFEIPKGSTIYNKFESKSHTVIVIATPEDDLKSIISFDGINWSYKEE